MKKFWSFFILTIGLSLTSCDVVEKLANKDPIIKNIVANPSQIGTQDTTTLWVDAEDPDGDMLSYRWESSPGGQLISTTSKEVQWIAPAYSGRFWIKVTVTDENGGKAMGEVFVNVRGDESPIVTITKPVENEIILGLGCYPIKVLVKFNWSIERVDFFIDRDLVFSDRTEPYEWTEWQVTSLSGPKLIVAKAYELGNLSNFGVDSAHVTIEGIVPIPKK